MTHTDDCFAGHYVDLLKKLKNRLACARMPAAKMEPKGKKVPIISDRAPTEINKEDRDLLVSDPDGQLESCRNLIRTFNDVMRQAYSSTLLKHHEDSMKWRKDS